MSTNLTKPWGPPLPGAGTVSILSLIRSRYACSWWQCFEDRGGLGRPVKWRMGNTAQHKFQIYHWYKWQSLVFLLSVQKILVPTCQGDWVCKGLFWQAICFLPMASQPAAMRATKNLRGSAHMLGVLVTYQPQEQSFICFSSPFLFVITGSLLIGLQWTKGLGWTSEGSK